MLRNLPKSRKHSKSKKKKKKKICTLTLEGGGGGVAVAVEDSSILFGDAVVLLGLQSHEDSSIKEFREIRNVVGLGDVHSRQEHQTASDESHLPSHFPICRGAAC